MNVTTPSRVSALNRLLTHPFFVPAVAIFGLLFRVAILLIKVKHPGVFADELQYESIAISLWKAHQYFLLGAPTAFRPPGEPFFMAGLYTIFGYAPNTLKIVQAVLLSALPFLCARLGRSIGLSVRDSNVGALLAGLHPGLAYAATTLYPTALTAVALTAGLVYSSSAAESGKKADAAKGGIALGLAGFLTTTFVPLPLLAAFYCLVKRRKSVAVMIAVLGMLPASAWMGRNHRVFGKFTVATNGGINLFEGANNESTPLSGNWIMLPPDDPGIAGWDEIAQDRMWETRAKAWIQAHPFRYAWLSMQRAVLVADSVGNPKTQGVHSGLAAKLVAWLMLPFVLLGFAGLAIFWRTSAGCLTAAALLLVVASSALTLVKPRFRFPLDPALAVFAVAAVPRARRLLLKLPEQMDSEAVEASPRTLVTASRGMDVLQEQ
jgi:hypothetical protein